MRNWIHVRLTAVVGVLIVILSCVPLTANAEPLFNDTWSSIEANETESRHGSAYPKWKPEKLQKETQHFQFFCADEEVSCLPEMAEEVEATYERLTTTLKKVPSAKTKIYVYPTLPDMREALGKKTDAAVDGVEFRQAIFLARESSKGTVVHEFAHVLVELFGSPVPSVLNEGLATYLALENRSPRRWIVPEGEILSLSDVDNLKNPVDDTDPKVYDYGKSYIEFLNDTFGFDTIISMLEGKPRSQLTGMGDEDLNELWLEYLKKKYDPAALFPLWYEGDRFDILSNCADTSLLENLKQKLEDQVEQIEVLTGCSIEGKTKVYVFSDMNEFVETYDVKAFGTDPVGNIVFASCLTSQSGERIVTAVPRENPIEHEWREELEAYTKGVLDRCDAPLYLKRGLLSYMNYMSYSEKKPWSVWDGEKWSVGEEFPSFSELEENCTYAFEFIEFVSETFGLNKVTELFHGVTRENALGLDDDECHRLWKEYVIAHHTDPHSMLPYLPPESSWAYEGQDILTVQQLGTPVTHIRVADIIEEFVCPSPACKVQVLNADGGECSNDDPIATGNQIYLRSGDRRFEKTITVVIPGDVTGQGIASIAQLVRLSRHITGAEPLAGPYEAAADMNADGTTTITDLVALAHIL